MAAVALQIRTLLTREMNFVSRDKLAARDARFLVFAFTENRSTRGAVDLDIQEFQREETRFRKTAVAVDTKKWGGGGKKKGARMQVRRIFGRNFDIKIRKASNNESLFRFIFKITKKKEKREAF